MRSKYGEQIEVVEQITGLSKEIRVFNSKRGCSAVRKICTVCQQKTIRKNDAQYGVGICFQCSVQPSLAEDARHHGGHTLSSPSAPARGLGSGRRILIKTQKPARPLVGARANPLPASSAISAEAKTAEINHENSYFVRESEHVRAMIYTAAQRMAGTDYAKFVRSLEHQLKAKHYLSARQYKALKKLAKPRPSIDPATTYPRSTGIQGRKA
jgi:hypothetical protein